MQREAKEENVRAPPFLFQRRVQSCQQGSLTVLLLFQLIRLCAAPIGPSMRGDHPLQVTKYEARIPRRGEDGTLLGRGAAL